ncbi:hypothetical protein EYZ11_001041 [Aspergillus tanneri]|uniref:Uncharacterized protein n=1 Tax=Aspergillus tanneri TaxID=1220188 RepID=A0A4S3JVM2_9EURO|nr:hypothetical protein EYZ11_001041 [Aspergillus tanneri]
MPLPQLLDVRLVFPTYTRARIIHGSQPVPGADCNYAGTTRDPLGPNPFTHTGAWRQAFGFSSQLEFPDSDHT